MIIREVNINDADALSDIYKYYADNFPYSFEISGYVKPQFMQRMVCTQKGVGKLLYENLLPDLKQQGYVKALAVLGCPNEGNITF